MSGITLSAALKQQQPDVAVQQWLEHPHLCEIADAAEVLKESLPEGLKEAADRMAIQAKAFLSKTNQANYHPSSYLADFTDFIISILDTIFEVFGIASLFAKKDYEWQDDQKSYKLMNLISYLGMFSGSILPLFGVEDGKKGIALALSTVMVASLIYSRFQPIPRSLPRGVNWSLALRHRELQVLEGEERHRNTIAKALKIRKKVMVIGETGVGKTETMKAFAQAVERGDYPFLKGKTIFYFNTAEIIDEFGGTTRGNMLPRINQFIGDNREHVILVFDEFHVACKGLMSDQMKTHLDPGPKSIPYFIGITTKNELSHFKKAEQEALMRRFEIVEVKRPDEDGVMKLLADLILNEMPEALIENSEDLLPYLIAQTKEALPTDKFTPYQVDNAIEVLRTCFDLIGGNQCAKANPEMLEEEAAVATGISLTAIRPVEPFPEVSREDTLRPRIQALKEKKKKILEEEGVRAIFFERRKQLLEVKKTLFKTAIKIANAAEPTPFDLAKFNLLGRHIEPLMRADLVNRATRLNVKTVINKELVDQAIQFILKKRTETMFE